MKIKEIRLFRVDLPLADPFQHSSSGLIDNLEEVVAAIETDEGVVGWAEVRGNCPYVTGDTPERIVAVARYLSKYPVGRSLSELALILDSIDDAVEGNSGAKALLDIALHDAYARSLGIDVSGLLGGRRHGRLPTNASVAFGSPDKAAADARTALADGFRVIKVRVGMDHKPDTARLAAVREVIAEASLEDDVILGADANGAWKPKEAVRILKDWHDFNLEYIEQPAPAHDTTGLRFVREHTDILVMADESAAGPQEVMALIECRAVDLLHFKLIKAGGFRPLKVMMALAETAGVPYMIGQMDEGILATAAAVHAAAVSRAKYYEVGCFRRVTSQPFEGIALKDGAVEVPSGPGLGVRVLEESMTCVHVQREAS